MRWWVALLALPVVLAGYVLSTLVIRPWLDGPDAPARSVPAPTPQAREAPALSAPALSAPEPRPAELVLPPVEGPVWLVRVGVDGVARVLSPAGLPMLEIATELRTAYAHGPEGSVARPTTQSRPGPWTRDPGATALSSQRQIGNTRWTLRLEQPPGSAELRLRVTVEAADEIYPIEEAVVLRVPSGATRTTVVDRAYRPQKLASVMFSDAWTPQVAFFGSGDTACALRAEFDGMVATPGTQGTEIRLEVSNARNAPFNHYRDCWPAYQSRQEKLRDPVLGPVPRGHVRTFEAWFSAGDSSPLRKLRYPRGYRAALAFTDHADQTSLERLGALMYGEWWAGRPVPGTPTGRGFAGRGLGLTKTLFHRTTEGYQPQLDQPEVRALVKALAAAGVDVGPHSVSAAPDDRDQTLEGLDVFAKVAASRTWIDHQPSTNCEALSNQGAWPGKSPYRVIEALAERGIRFAWAVWDANEPADGINLFDPSRQGKRTPLLFQHGLVSVEGSPPIYLFPSIWRGLLPLQRFLGLYDARHLDSLQRDRGLHIAHSYLEMLNGKRKNSDRALLEPRPGGGFRLKGEVDAMLADLASRQAAGHLWVAGIAPIGEHLIGMHALGVTYRADGGIVIENPTETTLHGASFLVRDEPGRLTPCVDGVQVPNDRLRREDGNVAFWFDLEPHARRVVTLGGSARPQVQPAQFHLEEGP